jgi:hypothetical protein
MLKDLIGNPIEVNSFVHVTIERPEILGRIIQIDLPSQIIPGGQNLRKHDLEMRMRSGRVVVMCPVLIELNNPANPYQVPQLLLTVDPNPEAAATTAPPPKPDDA